MRHKELILFARERWEAKNGMLVIDLTAPLSPDTPVYREGDYLDPTVKVELHASLETHPFAVHRLTLGSQSGTHVDAPAHLIKGGKHLHEMDLSHFVGPAFPIDLLPVERDPSEFRSRLALLSSESVLLMRASPSGSAIARGLLKGLIRKPAAAVLAGSITDLQEGYAPLRELLAQGVPVAEDAVLERAIEVDRGDLLVIAPLNLVGTTGAPCRVLAIRGAERWVNGAGSR